jgi:hypothetical protein
MISEINGLVQGTTAGHCAADGSTVKSGGGGSNWPTTVGVTNLNVFLASNPAYGDAQLIGPTLQNEMTRRIFESSPTTYRRIVTDKYGLFDLVAGVQLCKTGVGGGTTCGTVTGGYPQQYLSTNPNVGTQRTVENAVRISVSNGCFPGDSGGGVYHRLANNEAIAAGGITAYVLVVPGGTEPPSATLILSAILVQIPTVMFGRVRCRRRGSRGRYFRTGLHPGGAISAR